MMWFNYTLKEFFFITERWNYQLKNSANQSINYQLIAGLQEITRESNLNRMDQSYLPFLFFHLQYNIGCRACPSLWTHSRQYTHNSGDTERKTLMDQHQQGSYLARIGEVNALSLSIERRQGSGFFPWEACAPIPIAIQWVHCRR
jgi:hypothetical protein